MNRLQALLRNIRYRAERDRQIDEELASTVDALAAEKIARGVDAAEARRQAQIELGGKEQVRLSVREVQMGAQLETVWQDIRYAIRTLGQTKSWATVIVLSLALGIGANTLMFSLVNGLLLRKISVTDPDSLVRLRWTGSADLTGTDDTSQLDPVTGHPLRSNFSPIIFDQLKDDQRTLSGLAACQLQQVIVFANGESRWEDGLIASGNYYQMLGIHPIIGRTFAPDDDKPGAASVAVISYNYWVDRFSRRSDIAGMKILVNSMPVTIVGVTPAPFSGIQNLAEADKNITLPMEFFSQGRTPPVVRAISSFWTIQLMGRLRPGATASQVQANLNGPFQLAAQSSWQTRLSTLNAAQRALPQFQNRNRLPNLSVETGARGLFDPDPQTIRAGTILIIVVVLLLLIVCANVANLMLSRATTRRSEMSLRLSIGATRSRLIRQLLTESVILASIGGALGMLVYHWGRMLVPSLRSGEVAQNLPLINAGLMPELDWHILAFVACVVSLTALMFGLVPALRATQIDLATALKENSRSTTGRKSFLSRGLLVAQVAISLALLTGAGLFLRTVQNLKSVAVGFNPSHVLTFHISLRAVNGADAVARVNSLLDRISEKIRTLPGVESAGETSAAYWQTQVAISRPTYIPGTMNPLVMDWLVVSPGFFEALEIPLRSGRLPNVADNTPWGSPSNKVVINQAAADRLFPGREPIGQRLGFAPQTAGATEVIGVVGNTKYGDVRDSDDPIVYGVGRTTSFLLRTAGDPVALAASVREVVRQTDPMVPVTDIETQDDLITSRIQPERIFAGFYVLFGGLALLLASIGLFGLMSYSVARRTNEIGIRMALGAQRGNVLRLVLGESAMLTTIGVALGILISLAAGKLIASQLYGLVPYDFLTLAGSTLILLAVSTIAGFLPARRAARVDPLRALRHD